LSLSSESAGHFDPAHYAIETLNPHTDTSKDLQQNGGQLIFSIQIFQFKSEESPSAALAKLNTVAIDVVRVSLHDFYDNTRLPVMLITWPHRDDAVSDCEPRLPESVTGR